MCIVVGEIDLSIPVEGGNGDDDVFGVSEGKEGGNSNNGMIFDDDAVTSPTEQN
jgi:hypothetical protein